ncbi:MAG: DUF1826 domain-containing protein [Pseudomonadota bacterium]
MPSSNPSTLDVSTSLEAVGSIVKASESDRPSVLEDIFEDCHNIAIWHRNLSSQLKFEVKSLLASGELPLITLPLTPENCRTEMSAALHCFENTCMLVQDISQLVELFCGLFDQKQVKLRLTALDRVMCSRFHVDRVACRLVTTYHGCNTHWLPETGIDRTKLGRGNKGLPDELSGIYRSSGDIKHLTNGDVALLKGSLWRGNEHLGLVHRSPTPKPGESRLLMTLDFVSWASNG